jgi:hypothetical protein
MWKKWPSAEIGIVMGWPGKLIALVTDGPEGWQTRARVSARSLTIPIATGAATVLHSVQRNDRNAVRGVE